MCGIVGAARTDRLSAIDCAFIHAATRNLAHRGPDDEQIWISERAAFGHRRLAVIDVAGGIQPMHDSSGRYTLTYNGEVYNYRDLAEILRHRGARFRTHSDAEVILAAYEAWGPDCVTRFDGIFAFGIWDEQDRCLFLARDHLGVKPLLVWEGGNRLLFASDLKALLKHPAVARTIDPLALSDYLSLGYILSPKTILRDVRKIPPATWLLWRDGHARRQEYWKLADLVGAGPRRDWTLGRTAEHLSLELERAVCSQRVSDVPLGAYLSGGIDSTTVARKLVGCTNHAVRTFSIGFPDSSYNELDYARLAARQLRTEHVDEVIDPHLPSLLPQVAWALDEPLADTSSLPTWCLARLARQHVTVALSGDGGDELFAGYDTYLADRLAVLYRAVPSVARNCILRLSGYVPATGRKVGWDYKLAQFVRHAGNTPERAHYGWRLLFDEGEKRQLWNREMARAVGDYTPFDVFDQYFQAVATAPPLHRALYVDVKTWLVDAMLTKVDRTSMAHALEVRVPLLDRHLVEFAFSMPPEFKLKGLRTKRVLRRAMAAQLPTDVLRRSKRGFNAPVARWAPELPAESWPDSDDVLPGAPTVCSQLMKAHRSRQSDCGFKLWALLNWSLWNRHVMQVSMPVAEQRV